MNWKRCNGRDLFIEILDRLYLRDWSVKFVSMHCIVRKTNKILRYEQGKQLEEIPCIVIGAYIVTYHKDLVHI